MNQRTVASLSLLLIAIFMLGLLTGVVFQKYYTVKKLLEAIGAKPAVERVEIPVSTLSRKKLMVAIVFGQSNAANHGEHPKSAGKNVYNFFHGKLYLAQDPLLGADGEKGSVWTRLGDKIIASRLYDSVVFVPLGVAGSPISRWSADCHAPTRISNIIREMKEQNIPVSKLPWQTEISRWTKGCDLHPRILDAIRDLKAQHLPITHLLWHQGEADNLMQTRKSDYKRKFLSMLASIRRQGINAPIYVSVASRCIEFNSDPEIQNAQKELVNITHGIFPGPNTDNLGPEYRYEGCHFLDHGLDKFAEMWLEKLTPENGGPH